LRAFSDENALFNNLLNSPYLVDWDISNRPFELNGFNDTYLIARTRNAQCNRAIT
jgi:hypothetical protein